MKGLNIFMGVLQIIASIALALFSFCIILVGALAAGFAEGFTGGEADTSAIESLFGTMGTVDIFCALALFICAILMLVPLRSKLPVYVINILLFAVVTVFFLMIGSFSFSIIVILVVLAFFIASNVLLIVKKPKQEKLAQVTNVEGNITPE